MPAKTGKSLTTAWRHVGSLVAACAFTAAGMSATGFSADDALLVKNGPTTDGMVLASMLARGEQDEVLDAVVGSTSVAVMNDFSWSQLAEEFALHDEAVLIHPFVRLLDLDLDVAAIQLDGCADWNRARRSVQTDLLAPSPSPIARSMTWDESWISHDLAATRPCLVSGWRNNPPAATRALAADLAIELARHSTKHNLSASWSQ